MKKIYHPIKRAIKGKRKVVAMLISDKVEFKTKRITRDREGHYIMIGRVNLPRKHSNPNCVCTKWRAAKYVKLKMDIT